MFTCLRNDKMHKRGFFLSRFLDCRHVKWKHQGKTHTGIYEASNFD